MVNLKAKGGCLTQSGSILHKEGTQVQGPYARMDLAPRVKEILTSCCLCFRRCGVNRFEGQTGYCGLTSNAHYFGELINCSQELALIPSHTILFAGCNLRCDFCSTWNWNQEPDSAYPWNAKAMAPRVAKRRQEGARTLYFVGGEPTVSLFGAVDLIERLPSRYSIVWDSNMTMTVEARELLSRFVDVYAADFKFGNEQCAKEIADAIDYVSVVTENLRFAQRTARLIVRHLLIPGHFECCCLPILEWVSQELHQPRLHLRAAYMPRQKGMKHPDLTRYLKEQEFSRAVFAARELGIELID